MTSTAATRVDSSPVVVSTSRVEPHAQEGTRLTRRWRAITRGLADVAGLIGVIYLFPITVLAIGIPIALAIAGLLLAARWVWNVLG